MMHGQKNIKLLHEC